MMEGIVHIRVYAPTGSTAVYRDERGFGEGELGPQKKHVERALAYAPERACAGHWVAVTTYGVHQYSKSFEVVVDPTVTLRVCS